MLDMFTCDIPADHTLTGHGHSRIHLLVVAAGELQDRDSGSEPRIMARGCARLSPASAEHHLEFGGAGARCTIIEPRGPFWTRLFARALSTSGSSYGQMHSDPPLAPWDGSFERFLQCTDNIKNLGRLLAQLEHGETPPTIAWADDAMLEFDRPHGGAVSRIANCVDRNRAHFSRGFAKCFGLRPSEYRSLKRVLRALGDVAEGDEPFSSIALAHGYSDQSHMTNAFRAILGRSPSAARLATE
jgi:AraC-like DNA-binding protein